jgi:hypothetical protein
MNLFWLGFLMTYRPWDDRPRHPPNWINPHWSTNVLPPPFPRHDACREDHQPDTRCRMCERLIAEE